MEEKILEDEQSTTALLEDFFSRLSQEYVGANNGHWALVGIHRRGDILAERLRARTREARGVELPIGVLDITLYRDDFRADRLQPTVRPSQIPFEVEGANILLIDDVFQTGRTIRAALNQLADFGRPRRVVLAVFIDRHMRELPICPDLVGLTVDRPSDEMVQLQLAELDDRDAIIVRSHRGNGDAD